MSGPIGESRRAIPVGQADLARGRAGAQRRRCGGRQAGQRGLEVEFGRSSCAHLLVVAAAERLRGGAQLGQAAMDLGLDGAFGSAKGDGELGIGQAVDVAQDDGAPLAQAAGSVSRRCPVAHAASRCSAMAAGTGVVAVLGSRSAGNGASRDIAAPGRALSAIAATAQVQHDRRQPRSEPEVTDPGRVVARECPIRPHEGVLGGLLGVGRVAEDPQRDRVAAGPGAPGRAPRTSRRGPWPVPR